MNSSTKVFPATVAAPAKGALSARALRLVLVSASTDSPARGWLARADPEARVSRIASLAQCARCTGGDFDLVVLDASSVEVEAGGVSRLVDALSGLPVVVLSPQDSEGEARALIEAGAQDCLPLFAEDPARHRSALRHAVWRRFARDAVGSEVGVDPLTGLMSRSGFEQQFERAVHQSDRAGRQLAILMIALDGLDAINDGLGHDVGDLVLNAAASRLKGGTRRSDVVARLGGSNFALLLHDVAGEHAPARVAEYLLGLLGEPMTIQGQEYWIGANAGIAMFPRDGQNMGQLLGHAEVALHQARTRGRGTYRFHSESMNTRARKRLGLENGLRRALQHGGLQVAYQPQVETSSGRLVGAEALARWSDPDLGYVSPDEFIHVAEQTGLIVPLGEWMLGAATSQLGAWKRQGMRGLRMSVNVSAYQLERDDFREVVARALWEADLEPQDLILEVTESSLLENERVAIETLCELAQRGIGIALDDFGTGFSSLSFLKRFPLESVKIDRSFMKELVFDPDDRAIVTAILSIAKQLRLSVIAEGVETDVQRAFLAEHGCDEIQGFLISPAVEAEAFMTRFGHTLCPGAEVVAAVD